jgi:predicted metal-binding membrane protein
MFAMWVTMMTAMMVPSASPVIMIYARSLQARGASSRLPLAGFVLGYILAWTAFSAAATIAQATLQRSALLSADLRVGPLFGGIVLAAAGLYQVSSLKGACLRHCRSPIGFLMSYWRDGAIGAMIMGLRHGLYCVGCCWLLMALLFVAGVMNLVWVAGIAFFVLTEKVVPAGRLIATATGVTLIAAGVWMMTLS